MAACARAAAADGYALRAVAPQPSAPESETAWVDGAMLAQLEVAAFSQGGYSLLPRADFDELATQWGGELTAARAVRVAAEPPHLWLLIAERADGHAELAGVVSASERGHYNGARDMHIRKLAVLPRFAGRGGGAQLLAAVEHSARVASGALRATWLTLSVERSNAAAVRLYVRAGYRRTPWPPEWAPAAGHDAYEKRV